MNTFLLMATIFNQLWPLVHAGVQMVQANSPAGTPGVDKFNGVLNSVTSVVSAAPVIGHDLSTAQNAASSDPQAFASATGHLIEMSVALSKEMGWFKKAGIVQASDSVAAVVARAPLGGLAPNAGAEPQA